MCPQPGKDVAKANGRPAMRHAGRAGALLRDLATAPHYNSFLSALGMSLNYLLISPKRQLRPCRLRAITTQGQLTVFDFLLGGHRCLPFTQRVFGPQRKPLYRCDVSVGCRITKAIALRRAAAKVEAIPDPATTAAGISIAVADFPRMISNHLSTPTF